jgi:hypothetical protein
VDPSTSSRVIQRILDEYPGRIVESGDIFYRIRKAPRHPQKHEEYDSPPPGVTGNGRLDSPDFPVLYGSPDLQVCIHECRVTAEDELYVATLTPTSRIRLLDLSALLVHEETTEFESLDMAVHMLFLAASHSYPIARRICEVIKRDGFDGIVYPSYFSLLRLGAIPFDTAYGISLRRFPHLQQYEQAKAIPNLAIFGRPVSDGRIEIQCINKLVLNRVEYSVHFGPVTY